MRYILVILCIGTLHVDAFRGLPSRTTSPAMKASSGLPDSVAALLPAAAVADPGTVALWRALRKCYPSEEAAEAALRRNAGLLLPWLMSPSTIGQNYQVLLSLMDKEQTLDVITKNPGVLACEPERLAMSSPDEIKGFATFTDAVGKAQAPLAAVVVGLVTLSLLPRLGLLDEETAGSVVRPAVGVAGATAFIAATLGAIKNSVTTSALIKQRDEKRKR